MVKGRAGEILFKMNKVQLQKYFGWSILLIISLLFIFSFESSGNISMGKNKITYTPSSETHCSNNKCWTALYSGTRYVYEDAQWKRIEDARSLKDKGFYVKYLKKDSRYDFEIIDFNYTTIKFKPVIKDSNELNKHIPIKIDNIKRTTVLYNSLSDRQGFIFKSDNIFANNFTIGSASTSIILQDADTETLDDTYVSYANQNSSYGDFSYIQLSAGIPTYDAKDRNYVKFNISQIPSGQKIDEAILWIYYYENDIYAANMNVSIHHVYNHTWDEGITNWNIQPCGSNFDLSANCNLTPEDGQILENNPPLWIKFNVSKMVAKEYSDNDLNVSFALKPFDESTDQIVGAKVYSKEEGSAYSLYLNVTYSLAPAPPAPPTINDVSINPSTAFDNSTLECGAKITENDQGWAYTNFTWFFQNDGVGEWFLNTTEPLINITSGSYGNTTININSTWLDPTDAWICQAIAYDAQGSDSLNSSSVTIQESLPLIEIIYPVNGSTYINNVTELKYLYTAEYPDFCFYSLNDGANTTVSSCGANVTGINTVEGRNNWTIWINTTFGSVNKDTVRFDIDRWTENYQIYNNKTYETSNETFSINITLREDANFYSAELIYNNTSYATPDIETSGDSIILTKSIDIPLLNDTFGENITNEFYWTFIYTYGNDQIAQNSTKNYQNVSYINLQLCNTTYSTEALNFTFKDELTGNELNGTCYTISILYISNMGNF